MGVNSSTPRTTTHAVSFVVSVKSFDRIPSNQSLPRISCFLLLFRSFYCSYSFSSIGIHIILSGLTFRSSTGIFPFFMLSSDNGVTSGLLVDVFAFSRLRQPRIHYNNLLYRPCKMVFLSTWHFFRVVQMRTPRIRCCFSEF